MLRPAGKVGRKTGSGTGAAAASSKPQPKRTGRPVAAPRSAAAEIRRLTAELARARGRIRELEGLAETDPLLDIPNRRGVERELNRAIAYIRRYSGSGAVIALDVDRLKRVNDSLGHAAGDALLKAIAGVLQRLTRASDVIGRLGGDEFAVVLWNLTEADAQAKAASLEVAIDGLDARYRGRPLQAGASTGVAMIAGDDDASTVLDRADKVMYARKRARRALARKGGSAKAPEATDQAMISGVI